MTTLYQDLMDAGIEVANHESDLYFPDTEPARTILAKYPREADIATRFTNSRPPNVGERWVDVPFAFLPWWKARTGN